MYGGDLGVGGTLPRMLLGVGGRVPGVPGVDG